MSESKASVSGDIAIIGMSCLFANADGLTPYWQNICAGTESVGAPADDWEAERYLNLKDSTRISTARGGFLGDLYRFDAAKYGVMPSSVDGGEPDQFLALRVAIEALEDAGYAAKDVDHSRSGIILGHSTYLHRGQASVIQHGVVLDQTVELLGQLLPEADADALAQLRAVLQAQLPSFNSDVSPGLVPNVMTGRIANKLNFQGPNYLIDAACASSLLAMQSAMVELRAGRSDLMLAGGVNASIPAEVYSIFTLLGALSESGHVRPFDDTGDGTLLGEGLGVITLKRLEDAQADGDRIYAVLKGIGQSSDGRGAGLLAPRLEGEVLAIERAYEDANMTPAGVGLIEAHGTAIPLGDRTEIAALKAVFDGRQGGLPTGAIGSVKSMIGHCIPAAGVAGVIKTALALYHRTLPPTVCGAVRVENGLEDTPFYVNTETTPWIHSGDQPRRAGVNSFGFGGVNAHAVLEAAEGPRGQAPATAWPSELVLLGAVDVPALAARVSWLREVIAARPDVSLASLAATLADAVGPDSDPVSASGKGATPSRLALVATSLKDLDSKLEKAQSRLQAGRGSFQMRSGVFAAEAPVEGKLAFVYPGEGAQYQGMLNDILIAFPEARQWFDFWDGVYAGDRPYAPSTCVFPPTTTLDSAMFDQLEQALFGLEIGSESVFVASQALGMVTKRLGLVPDAVVGHSSGEHSALRAAGVLGSGGEEELRGTIRELNAFYRQMDAAGAVGNAGSLLTVGAIDRNRILELVAPGGVQGDVHLALDNCEHQAVLFGAPERMQEVAKLLRSEGGMCAFLPFDRPYHTPLFAPVADMVRGVYDKMDFTSPDLPVYSCASTELFDTGPDAIRDLAAQQWQSRVRFTETIQRMYDDGVRIFVEVGPSANLTGFVDDVLKGKGALAVSMDSRRRPSLLHLQQTLGRIWLTGRDMTPGALFADREIDRVDLDAKAPPQRSRLIPNTLPFLRLNDDQAATLRGALMPRAPAMPGQPGAPFATASSEAVQLEAEQIPANAVAAPSAPAGAEGAMAGHFALMQEFLQVEQGVVSAALGADMGPEGFVSDDPVSEDPVPLHFIHHVLEQDAQHLVAQCDIDIEADAFLAEHILYTAQTSDLDPGMGGLPVVPLAVSLEMLVEAAVALGTQMGGGQIARRLEQVRTFDWVIVETGVDRLTLTADLQDATTDQDPDEIRIMARVLRGDVPLVEATVVLGPSPQRPSRSLPALTAPRPPVWKDEDLYTTGMFHGPLYHSVAALQAWDDTGIDALLNDTPLQGFSDQADPAGLVLNPVLLDGIGHATAFWIAQGLGTDFSSFPSSIERIELCAARREDTGGAQLQARVAFEGGDAATAQFLCGDFICTGADGQVIFAALGWRDRFFRVPNSFYHARFKPRDSWYGEEVSGLFGDLPDQALIWSVPKFFDGFLTEAGGIWRKVLSRTLLSGEELAQFHALPPRPKRLEDWLVGRIAIKEAARQWILRHYGVLLMPADLVVRYSDSGKPYLSGEGLDHLGPMPEISVAHSGGEAVAAASRPGQAVGVDFEWHGRIKTPDLLQGGFSAAEQAVIAVQAGSGDDGRGEARALLGWCAKEAAAKLLGEGLNGRPRDFVLHDLAPSDRSARIDAPTRPGIHVSLVDRGAAVLAVAFD